MIRRLIILLLIVGCEKTELNTDDCWNLLGYEEQSWGDSGWSNAAYVTYTYDENNNKIEYRFQTWEDSIWVNVALSTYMYDENRNITEELIYVWNGSDWMLNNYTLSVRFLYTYDVNNNIIEMNIQDLDGSVIVRMVNYIYESCNQ